MKTMCRDCLQLKPKVRAEKVPGRSDGSCYFRDLEGRRWQGARCPDCHVKTVKERNYKNKEEKPAEVLTKRRCRSCSSVLPAARYFKCFACSSPTPNTQNSKNYDTWDGSEYGYSYVQYGEGY